MAGRKDVSAITVFVALPASARKIFKRIWATATAWDDVVDGCLIGNVIVAEKRGAAGILVLFSVPLTGLCLGIETGRSRCHLKV
jgi:hypothetical protein